MAYTSFFKLKVTTKLAQILKYTFIKGTMHVHGLFVNTLSGLFMPFIKAKMQMC